MRQATRNILAIAASVIGCMAVVSCSEDSITPSDNHLVKFPQGNADYDMIIKEIYDSTGTQMLYDYSDDMFRWMITERLPYISTPANKEEDKQYVANAVNFMKENCFELYNNDFLRKILPYRIYLASNLARCAEFMYIDVNGVQQTRKDTINGIACTNGFRNMCFGLVNKRLAEMSEDSLKLTRGELNASLISNAISQGLMRVPEEFAKLEFEGVNWSSEAGAGGYNAYGLIEYIPAKTMSPQQDFAIFLKMVIAYTKEEFEARFCSPTFDLSGRIKTKGEIVREYLKAYM